MAVKKISYQVPVNVVDGVPQCFHGDPMVEYATGEWMCPDGALVLNWLWNRSNEAFRRLAAERR